MAQSKEIREFCDVAICEDVQTGQMVRNLRRGLASRVHFMLLQACHVIKLMGST